MGQQTNFYFYLYLMVLFGIIKQKPEAGMAGGHGMAWSQKPVQDYKVPGVGSLETKFWFNFLAPNGHLECIMQAY
jgi:hypothetical protein